MSEPRRRLTRRALHGKEERFKRVFRDQIAEAAGILEVVLSGIVLAALFLALAFVLPMITGHVPQVGNMLCTFTTKVFI